MKKKSLFKFIKEKDPSSGHFFNILINYPGVHALFIYRLARIFYLIKLKTLARFISGLGRFCTGIEIHPGAKIGRALFIDHGMGVVIGQTAIIGNYVCLFQGVTLGASGKTDKQKRHPTIADEVTIYAGANVLGDIVIGKGAIIGASSVVNKDVLPYHTVVGIPARVIKEDNRL